MGGYKSSGGSTVLWRKLFRCGHLSNLVAPDLEAISKWDLRHVHDLRRRDEQIRHPTALANVTVNTDYQMSFGSTGAIMQMAQQKTLTADSARELMSVLYRKALHSTTAGLGQFVKNVAAQEGAALIIHCTAGKDRTGVAAAALMMALGMDETSIIEDYLLTQEYGDAELIASYVTQRLTDNGVTQVSSDALLPYCSVETQYIESFLTELSKTYGSYDDYLRKGLGVTTSEIEAIQSYYLQ